ncbi:nitrilase-related carbon-nitrogen hydrolase [Francisella adeliensis]|uniref:Carbon-nitrogen hydrolase n=1 Tax=Francisella adeliensis TaxID=2007306 RepID=A0A2Z4Y1J3_9GAMM|nr:nitrilase-related carbon-nitrogen hydrolase [Francisella adeliensis]AXA34365.1 carbon-nitrogen hydrolase [Francisella adeliensis]MBK2086452.1 carbon-nitrogen hydrolase [Francisella adeliensis]MBK2096080.1 carbon-nitrogen hydrolase [Francisella adeliensis]QIW12612.1 carbon-nitrogen hydrolase [Francisella adeliensis]QIW14485.1 carbon-nitrogen hydrolase [Francisella adeliensis]
MKFRVFLGLVFALVVNLGFADSIKVSAVQMLAHQQSFEEFKADVSRYVEDAKKQNADIVVFPEDNTLNLIYDLPWKKSSLLNLAKFYDAYKAYLLNLAKQEKITIVGGTIVRVIDEKIYNTLIVALPNGEIIEHDKIYLTPVELAFGYNGKGDNILVLDTDKGKVVILICYTSEFANISIELAKIEPDLIIVPSYTDDIYGLSRVQSAIKILSIQNFAYGLVVGMVSNRSINDLEGADGVAQALFVSPQQKGFPLDHLKRAKFNHEEMISYDFNITKLHNEKKVNDVFPHDGLNIYRKVSFDVKSIEL